MYIYFHAYPVPLDLLHDARRDPSSFMGTEHCGQHDPEFPQDTSNPLQLSLGTSWELLQWLFDLSIDDLLGPQVRSSPPSPGSLRRRLLGRVRPRPVQPPPARPAAQMVAGTPRACAHGWVPCTQVFDPLQVAAIAADLSLWTPAPVAQSCGEYVEALEMVPATQADPDFDVPFQDGMHAAQIMWARLQAAQNYTRNLSLNGLGMLTVIG